MKKFVLSMILFLFSTTLFAQNDLTGTWNTGKENTLVKIYEKEGLHFGEIVSSDNPKVKIGKQIIKNVELDGDEWEGELFAVKKQEWYDAEFKPEGENMEITIKVGFFSKTVEWKKVVIEEEEKSEE
jgi:hypothetical protein